jgi:cell division protein FtsB
MRSFVFVLALILIVVQARLWLSDGGLREYRALRSAVGEQSERNATLAARNEALAGEVRDLKQGVDAAEERARTDLGMVRNDETFFLVVTRDDAN